MISAYVELSAMQFSETWEAINVNHEQLMNCTITFQNEMNKISVAIEQYMACYDARAEEMKAHAEIGKELPDFHQAFYLLRRTAS